MCYLLDWTGLGNCRKRRARRKFFAFASFLSVCLSICLSTCLATCLAACLSVRVLQASLSLSLSYLISGIRSSDFSLFLFSDSMGIFGVSPISIFTLPYLT